MPIAPKSARSIATLSLACSFLALADGVSGQEIRPVAVPRLGTEPGHAANPLSGTSVVIGPDLPATPGTTYRWTQVEGPPVRLDNPSTPQIRVTVPRHARSMAFSLCIKDAKGEKTLLVPVPIGPDGVMRTGTANAPPSADVIPLAIAGGDKAGDVGHEIVLDGAHSRPLGRVGYRWIQLSGPEPARGTTSGSRLSFVPETPGTYRFALLVGADNRISEPDVVSVVVTSSARRPISTPPAEPSPLARWFAGAVWPIPRGPETASQVADAFEAISGRVPLYSSYAQLQAEMTRRLDVIVPTDFEVRKAWAERVFTPLSWATLNELRALGIDPSVPATADRVLDEAQKSRLQMIYRNLADACRPIPRDQDPMTGSGR